MNNDLKSRIERLEKVVAEMQIGHECINKYYIDLIRECAEVEAKAAVAKMLEKPIEMTIEDIEKAFNHKVKIVQK